MKTSISIHPASGPMCIAADDSAFLQLSPAACTGDFEPNIMTATSCIMMVSEGRTTTSTASYIGRGFGGLNAARELAHEHLVRVTTQSDRRNHHLFQPLLYQVATACAAQSGAYIAVPIRRTLRHQKDGSKFSWPKLAPSTSMPRSSRSTKTSSRTTTSWWPRARAIPTSRARRMGAVRAGAQEHWRRAGGSARILRTNLRAGQSARRDPRSSAMPFLTFKQSSVESSTGVELSGALLRGRAALRAIPRLPAHQPGRGTRHSRRRFGSRASKPTSPSCSAKARTQLGGWRRGLDRIDEETSVDAGERGARPRRAAIEAPHPCSGPPSVAGSGLEVVA